MKNGWHNIFYYFIIVSYNQWLLSIPTKGWAIYAVFLCKNFQDGKTLNTS